MSVDQITRELSAQPRAEIACPVCGEPAEADQLVCLTCGSRLALDYRRPSSWKPAVAIVAVVVAALGAGFAALVAASDDDSGPPAKASTPAPTATGGSPAPSATTPAEPRRATGDTPSAWPANTNGYTVILLTTGDRAGAAAAARTLRQQGVEVGVLESSRYPSLPKGYWNVFYGAYPTRAGAEATAARLKGNYPGAYPQYVEGAADQSGQ